MVRLYLDDNPRKGDIAIMMMSPPAARDDVTVRIDIELRAKAKELDINMSRLLEGALRDEIDRIETIAKTLEGAEEIKLDLEDNDGRPYVGRLTGKFLGEGHGAQAFVTTDGRVIVYDSDCRTYFDATDQDAEVGLQAALESVFPYDPDVISDVMHAIGETPEIDL
jgi:post-segregation antitoxin (ccd killing protein)